ASSGSDSTCSRSRTRPRAGTHLFARNRHARTARPLQSRPLRRTPGFFRAVNEQEDMVRTIRGLAMVSAAVAVASCSNQSNPAVAADEQLSRDLAIAASEAVELAPRAGGHALSAAEIAPPAAPARRSSSAP